MILSNNETIRAASGATPSKEYIKKEELSVRPIPPGMGDRSAIICPINTTAKTIKKLTLTPKAKNKQYEINSIAIHKRIDKDPLIKIIFLLEKAIFLSILTNFLKFK